MNNGNGNGNTVLLTVIGIATLLVALVGATFAYFTATVNNDQAQSVTVTTATPVGLEYVGSDLKLENTIPGNSSESTFTVTNPEGSTVSQTYDLNLIIDQNTFVTDEGDDQLAITITAESTGANTPTVSNSPYNVTDGTETASAGKSFVVVGDQKIDPEEVQTYSIKVEFKELDAPQNTNVNKTFGAHIEISDAQAIK